MTIRPTVQVLKIQVSFRFIEGFRKSYFSFYKLSSNIASPLALGVGRIGHEKILKPPQDTKKASLERLIIYKFLLSDKKLTTL